MATTYKKNARNIYKIPFYALFWFWWSMLVLIAGLVTLLVFVMMSKWLLVSIIALWSLVAILTVWRICKFIKVIRLAGSFSRYRVENRARKSVTKSLLATMTLNRLQDTPYISVPDVVVCLADDHIQVRIEKLARAVSCFLIFGNQSALAEKSISTDIRGQFAIRVVLGKVGGNGEEYRMVFGEVATKGSVERFKGYYLTDGLEQPQLFAVPDLHKHGLNDLKVIKRAFEIGQEIAS